ncbi:uncharacterized protein PFLUO_LOCUS1169 [Penicillium psychrofluorescens]|uniref:uncharacterized protein n=1 Tax=Penicillium psychrofluorescens TaxID=3158075 RepID=UPI003CCC9E83
MSADATDTNAPQSQFQKIGDLVEQDEDTGLMSVESLCMNCHESGTTRLLLLKVPFFRDVILESFECPHCYFKDNSVKSAGQIQEKGSKYTLVVENEDDLQRQVIRSDVSIFKVETLGIEMPKGESQLTNIEGVITRIHDSLANEQPLRKAQAPELHDALEPLIQKLKEMSEGNRFPFTVSVDDPTGNSWIAPNTTDRGSKYRRVEYPRTAEQNEELGLASDPETGEHKGVPMGETELDESEIVDGQVYTLPAQCPACTKPCVVNMKKVHIPHFKEVFIWSTVCDGTVVDGQTGQGEGEGCGYKSNEVKTGGEIPEKGKRITLKVENIVDLSRDILKSDTCALSSQELELEVQPGTLGGRFTTIEGLLTEIKEQLSSNLYDIEDVNHSGGDSMVSSDKQKWDRFFANLDSAISGELKFTITLEDPLANSYVQDLCSPAADPQITIEDYTRTDEEEDDLGLKDMKTEGYEEEEQKS